MGLRRRAGHPDKETVALPFVYALLSHKTKVQYTAILQAVKDAVAQFRVPDQFLPEHIMSDFEKGIHNACATVYPSAVLRSGVGSLRVVFLFGTQRYFSLRPSENYERTTLRPMKCMFCVPGSFSFPLNQT